MEQNQQYDNIGLLYVCVSICMYVWLWKCICMFKAVYGIWLVRFVTWTSVREYATEYTEGQIPL